MSAHLINDMTANIMTLNHADRFTEAPASQLIESKLTERSESVPKNISKVIIDYIKPTTVAATEETIAKRSEPITREISQIILGYTGGKFKAAADVAERILHIYADIIGEARQATPQEQQALRDLRDEYHEAGNGIGIPRLGDSEMEIDGKFAYLRTNRAIINILENTGAIPPPELF